MIKEPIIEITCDNIECRSHKIIPFSGNGGEHFILYALKSLMAEGWSFALKDGVIQEYCALCSRTREGVP